MRSAAPRAGALAGRVFLRRASWTLARLRAGRPLKAVDVAREFDVSLRTVYRDLDHLRDEWRVPLEFDRAEGTFRLTEPTAFVPPVTLSRGEVVAVFFAERVVRQYRGTPFEPELLSALRKIQELLPEEVSIDPETLDDALSLDLGPAIVPEAATFSSVLESRRRRRVALIRYHSLNSGRTGNRRIRPYHVFNFRGDWYVAAFDERRDAVRDFAIHRIRRLTLTTEAYEVPADFDFRRYAAEAFGIEKGGPAADVTIRFSSRQARWIRERRWHRTAEIEERLDGGCVLRLRAAGLDEVRRWVLQFGAEAEVLAPARLRRAVADELSEALKGYRRAGRTP